MLRLLQAEVHICTVIYAQMRAAVNVAFENKLKHKANISIVSLKKEVTGNIFLRASAILLLLEPALCDELDAECGILQVI